MTKKIIKNQELPESDNPISEAIIEISSAMRKLQEGTLQIKTIVLLVHDYTSGSVTKKDIRKVFEALPELEREYLKPKKKPNAN